MTKSEVKAVRELAGVLKRIKNGELFNINLARLERMGLIKIVDFYKYDNYGNKLKINGAYVKKDFKVFLTPKAKLFLKINI